jgi:1,2-phenylacetyl-CoA epoxidase PaaB subunit
MTVTAQTRRKTIDRLAELGSDEPIHYECFARRDSSMPLTHIGSVEAPNLDLAKARAWFVYTEHKWQEFCIVPTSAVVSLTETGDRKRIKEV